MKFPFITTTSYLGEKRKQGNVSKNQYLLPWSKSFDIVTRDDRLSLCLPYHIGTQQHYPYRKVRLDLHH